MSSEHRQKLLQEIANGYSITIQDGALRVSTAKEKFGQRMHDLIVAMLSVNDLYYVSTHHVKSLFFEEVVKWFDEKDIRFRIS